MSLPPGFLDELHQRTSIVQVAGRKVTWDHRQSNPGKGDMWAPCPFHQEKTASFHVDDQKGLYYCFGCHAKGNTIEFLKQIENIGFMEAVEILAREAGMAMPARDPQAREKADRHRQLAGVMDQATRFFRRGLSGSRGAGARDYLEGRGLTGATCDRFEIGFAPDDHNALLRYMTEKGVSEKDLIETGLVIRPDNGGTVYDRFRGRIMFPIRDARSRCIAFGGRALSPEARARYLNSPKTELFDKGRSLYNFGPAREAVRKTGSLIVAEGYMDVIALAQAGFDHAVAPLGTAVTEDQLQLLWRVSDEPIMAFDGDRAGLRAAYRLIDLALPMLRPGRSLRFAILPQGQDPDNLIKISGSAAMQKLLDSARPMVKLLWQRETEGKTFDSPERRAGLDATLRMALRNIRDTGLRRHYGDAIQQLRQSLFRPSRAAPWQRFRHRTPTATHGSRASILAQAGDKGPERLREALILTAAIRCPAAALEMEDALERLPISSPDLAKILAALLASLNEDLSADATGEKFLALVTERLGTNPMEPLLALPRIRMHPMLRPGAPPERIGQTLREELVKHAAIKGAETELEEAARDLDDMADEGLTWRIQQAADARDKATRARIEAGADTENRENLSKGLQKLLDDQVWVKKKG
ncbi:MAG: DNA primase [Rhodobacteraceae bacterium]|nr:DNA primase [Paracoccaceae bacterium]